MSSVSRAIAYVLVAAAAGVGIVTSGSAFAQTSSPAALSASGSVKNLEATIAELQAEVAKLKDRQQVHDVYARYGRGIDRLDEDLYRSAFWPDAQINYGTAESITVDQHWNDHMLKGHKEYLEAWAHLLTNETADIDGDVAHVEVYVTRFAVPRDKNDTRRNNAWSGRYIDRLDRRHGEWRIAVREFIPHFSMKVDVNYHTMWDSLFENAKLSCFREPWAKQDTSYVRPLVRRTNRESGPPCAK